MSYPLLERINAPGEIKNLPASDMPALCEEIRQFLIKSVSETGGHLSSNLGVVELTVALHRVLDFPQDKLLFDVGHQCYPQAADRAARGLRPAAPQKRHFRLSQSAGERL